MRRHAAAVFLTCFLWGDLAFAQDISVAVDYEGRQIQLIGRFEKPAGPGPFPVVIALHDCGGVYKFYSSVPAWVALLQLQGYATLRLDSFTARGHAAGICGDVNAVSSAERAQDALAAAYVLAGRPDVRPDRIALIGRSHGAGGAIYAARDHDDLRPWREKLAARGGKLAASVVLYGGCGRPEAYPVVLPLLVLAGAKDDWTGGAASCAALANAQAKPIVTVQVYPDAYHGFDTPGDSHYFLGHMIAYDAAATADARTRIVEFLNRFLH